MGILQTIVAVLIPPLGVFWKKGFGFQFFLSILLTVVGYLPGVIYALYVVVLSKD
ncbi:MAG: YqaE/Pmp3 family membrane protein [Chloroflexia bacterium]|nr:YqaE/Pmp3 family membrane protein [Chloroflexia bacterium]